ncbi:unnamed protein product [Oikopleura dioica]|uniref:Uncharacterized protein n=1 Tax=Oikopleura dioica TaxID=34765 RepID=E4XJL3_OIKDI|nr:unnamed protein product [Oikopleura dioica]
MSILGIFKIREVDSLSRRISKLIEENERVLVGPRQNNLRRNSLVVEPSPALGNSLSREDLKAPGGKSPRRKSSVGSLSSSRRSSRTGPWRYEERILQLGYNPSTKNNSTFSRRNSLPVDCSPPGKLPCFRRGIPSLLPAVSSVPGRAGRRASLPAISGGSLSSSQARCLLEMHHEPELGASAAALDHPQERRTPPMKREKGTKAAFSFYS